jgi:probable rRNA maturation factor
MSRVTVFFEESSDMPALPEDYRKNILVCLNSTAEKLGQDDRFEVCLTVVDNAEIRELNFHTREIDKVTDVLSFPMLESDTVQAKNYSNEDRNPQSGAVILGDIVISVERAREQARIFGHSLMREMCFLSVHSMLHLFGYDHVDNEEEEVFMVQMQNSILSEAGITREGTLGEADD